MIFWCLCHRPCRLGKAVVVVDGLHYHFRRYVYLVGCDVFRVCELLDG